MRRKQQWTRRQRAAVLWGLAAFVFLQIGFGAALETGVVEIRDNTTYSYRAANLRNRLEAAAEPPFTVVMFGSSRVMNAYKADEFEAPLRERTSREVVAYNFGIPSAGHIYAYFSLRKLLAEGVRPDVVLFEVTLPFLAGQASTELDWFAGNELRTREFEVDQRYGLKEEQVAHHSWETWLAPWYTHRFFVLNTIEPRLLPTRLRKLGEASRPVRMGSFA